jgi:hypothetical protein
VTVVVCGDFCCVRAAVLSRYLSINGAGSAAEATVLLTLALGLGGACDTTFQPTFAVPRPLQIELYFAGGGGGGGHPPSLKC